MARELVLRTRNGEGRAVPKAALETLRSAIQGTARTGGDPGYEETRTVWNGMIDRFPALIVSCRTVQDVRRVVAFAQEQEALLAVRGGGHSFAGHSTCDGGIVLDLSPMTQLHIDPHQRIAIAGPGLRWADLDQATQQYDLAVTGGQISHTGIAGLTLGGGMGWLARQFGLTIDHLIGAEVITADGEQRRAAADADTDLFWGIRGGGGNFGVVTSFTYQLCLLGPQVTVTQIAFPIESAPSIFPAAEAALAESPATISGTFAFLWSPDGHPLAALTVVSTAAAEAAERELAPFQRLDTPVFQETVRVPYTALQRMLDRVAAPGLRYDGRGNFLDHLAPSIVEPLASAFVQAPSQRSFVLFVRLGGAVAETPVEATAFAHRAHPWALTVLAIWQEPSEDEANRTWIERTWATLPPVPRAVYVNELGDEGTERVRAAYGPNDDRLRQLKRRYDPQNLFRLNQNIPPA